MQRVKFLLLLRAAKGRRNASRRILLYASLIVQGGKYPLLSQLVPLGLFPVGYLWGVRIRLRLALLNCDEGMRGESELQ